MCSAETCEFSKPLEKDLNFTSEKYFRLRPESLREDGNFSVILAVKPIKSGKITYAQYFARIPAIPEGERCYHGPGSKEDFIEINCETWKSDLSLIFR